MHHHAPRAVSNVVRVLSTVCFLMAGFFLGFPKLHAQLPSYVPSSGLVAYWPLNGSGANAGGWGNNALVVGALPASDRHGNTAGSLEFSPGSYLVVPNNPTLHFPTQQITLAAWVYLPDTLENARIFSKDWNNTTDRDFMGKLQNNVWYAGTYSEDGNFIIHNAPAPISNQQWHHLVYTKDTSARLYVDGALVGVHNASNAIHYSPADLYLGKANPWETEYFVGKMDDVGLWSRALSPNEVSALYTGCTGTVSQQPSSTTAYTQPGWATFSCQSSDTTANYQWEVNAGTGWTDIANFGPYSGASSNQLLITGATPALHRNGYRCRISGCETTWTNPAVLSVVVGLDTQETNFSEAWLAPNPTTGILVFNAALSGTYRWTDACGRTVEQGSVLPSTAATRLDIQHFASGIYLLEWALPSGQRRLFRVVRQ